jgi:GH35 family endo-1,4-beta-xylanase
VIPERQADATVTVVDATGTPVAGEEVVVAQRRHRFLFGGTDFDLIGLANGELSDEPKDVAERSAVAFLDLFDFATLPFYWGRFEPVRGRPDTARILAAARWLADRGVRLKGHPLCWHTVTADWLLDLPVEGVIDVQLARIRRDVADFAGLIDAWDVINEVVIMPVFDRGENGITRMAQRLGRVGIVQATFAAARETNPTATLLLNDFDMSADYERLIEDCLAAGIRIDALGLQSHMHQGYWGVEKTLAVLERFSRFGLPIHFTESTLVSGHLMPPEIVDLNDYQVSDWPTTPEGEARQADEVETHYRTLYGHPSVEAITWWGFPDGGWLNAPTGLVRVDGSPKPAYERLRGLVKGEWWLPATTMRTDDAGRIRLTASLGDYEVTSRGRTAGFALEAPGSVEARAVLPA